VNKLDQNYPNPFNPTTVITYQLLTHGYATLKVYDVLGREVATLVNGEKSSGVHTVSWDASRLSSGVFIYRLKIGNFNDVKKMILMK
jgi:flagellar hook assembly protein FlgD